MSSLPNDKHHSNIESNHIDPDDGNSWLCTACNLPIFATPFTGGGTTALLHNQCADLPEILQNCELHPQKPLLLGENKSSATCSECSEKCGSKLYLCPDSDCGLVLDVACAVPIKILHRSHRHRLTAVRSSSFHKCGICGTTHEAAAAAKSRSYFCNVCGFWIHPDCATSAHVIVHEKHVHPLVLYYDVHAAFGAQTATLTYIYSDFIMSNQHNIEETGCSICAICGNDVATTRFGVYSCIDCRHCTLHINCATSDRRIFKPVLGREAQFANVVRLPIPDEYQSIERHVRSSSITNKGDRDPYSIESLHQLICGDKHHITKSSEGEDEDENENENENENEDENDRRVCDACLKIIKSPDPFYSCSICPYLFLHDFCYRIPTLLVESPAHLHGHGLPFYLIGHIENDLHRQFFCDHCKCQFIRGRYSCFKCNANLDVSCGLMPDVITHDEHATSHFMRLSNNSLASCDCCGRSLGKLAYECRTCWKFALHTWCAMLPRNVTHKFDPHPLQLITSANANANKQSNINNDTVYDDICEICESGIDDKVWYYGCKICDQSFHVDCIPCLDIMYKIKSLLSAGDIPADSRDVPTRLIRGLTLQGHGHDYCSDVADEYDEILVSHD